MMYFGEEKEHEQRSKKDGNSRRDTVTPPAGRSEGASY